MREKLIVAFDVGQVHRYVLCKPCAMADLCQSFDFSTVTFIINLPLHCLVIDDFQDDRQTWGFRGFDIGIARYVGNLGPPGILSVTTAAAGS